MSKSPTVPTVEEIIRKLMPTTPIAKGTVTATGKGWVKIFYYDPLTHIQVKFAEVPTVVAVAEVRAGKPPKVTAPTISIPSIAIATTKVNAPGVPSIPDLSISIPAIDMPVVPAIDIPEVSVPAWQTVGVPWLDLPAIPAIDVPEPAIPYSNENFPAFYAAPGVGHDVVQALCDQLNKLRDMLYKVQGSVYTEDSAIKGYGANLAIYYVNYGLKVARKALLDIVSSIQGFRGNLQGSFNTLRDNVQASINNSLSDIRNKTQAALNVYRGSIQSSLNSSLADARAKTQAGLNTLRDNTQGSVNTALKDTRDKMHEALSNYASRITEAVNAGLADSRAKTQEALKAYQSNIQTAVNAGLNNIIPILYEQIGLPTDQLISPINLRNVTNESFEFYALSPGIKLHYVAIGKRA
jgi:hypothetical protein